MSNNPIAVKEVLKAGFDDFVVPVYESAPYTTIVNRAQVTRSLKAIAGIERVMVRGISRLQNEFGPNGERVWEADNKDARIRFVGAITGSSTTEGTCVAIGTADTSSYIEVTAYCTGLNILMAARLVDLRVSVDGAAETTVIGYTESGVLQSRNYGMNQVVPASSGLTLGWHTFKFRRNSSGNSWLTFGFEILNERSDIAVYSGAGISQGAYTGLSSLSTSAFNDGVAGSKGARVVKYIEDGTLKSAVQEVDATAKYLTNTDHTNEEVVRRINFREFGANRADDFSTLSTSSNRAFTLDDGTTTLVGSSVRATTAITAFQTLEMFSASQFVTLTFVGCGLDIVMASDSATFPTVALTVDGASAGNITTIGGVANSERLVKICSGLHYGTHSVKLTFSSGASVAAITDFIIYQPKKPSLPSGAFEVADYNLMASYSTAGTTDVANGNGIVQGALWKAALREVTYVGAWLVNPNQDYNPKCGFAVYTTTNGNSFQYTFFGNAVAIEFNGASANTTCTISIDGALNALGSISGVGITNGGGGTYNLLTPDAPTAGIVSFTGLSLGKHTITVTKTAVAGTVELNGLFIGTPIHINSPTLRTGSTSLKSKTKFSPEKVQVNAGPDLSKAKAWVVFDGVNQFIYKSFNISAVLRTATGVFNIYFEKPFRDGRYSCVALCNSGQIEQNNIANPNNQNFIQVQTKNDSNVLTNDSWVSLVFFGELIDE